MKIKVKANAEPRCFTIAELEDIAANLTIERDCNVREVTYSESPPSDTTLPWIKTECGAPVGRVRVFTSGEWREQ